MAGPLLYDRVKETTTTTGTGTLTLAGASTGYRAFSTIGNSNTTYYAIAHQTANEWEVGVGTYTLSGTTLSRTTILASSNAGSAVNFSAGTKDVFNTIPASIVNASGATLPTVAMVGQIFFHTPTGRTFLMQYDGSSWMSLRSYGTTTIYVDGASGSDTQNNGGATGASAFDTIQYAINQLPGSIGGNVTINIAAATYTEKVVIQGKVFTGNYTITLQGTMTQLDSLTASSGTTGSGATQGTTVRSSGTWTSNQRQHKIIRYTSGNNNGVYRVIDSNTTTTITICSIWDGSIANGNTFVVEDWGTIIDGTTGSALQVAAAQVGIVCRDIKFVDDGTTDYRGVRVDANASASIYKCWLPVNAVCALGAYLLADTCFCSGGALGRCWYPQAAGASIQLYRTKTKGSGAGYYTGFVQDGGFFWMSDGCISDGASATSGSAYGIYVYSNSILTLWGGNSGSLNIHRDWSTAGDIAIRAESGAQGTFTGTGSNTYTNNDTDRSADATTFAVLAD